MEHIPFHLASQELGRVSLLWGETKKVIASAQFPSNKRNGVHCNISFHLLVEICHTLAIITKKCWALAGFCMSRSLQSEATDRAGKNSLPCLFGSCLFFSLHSLPEAIGLSDQLKDVPFACQPIQQGGRHNFIPKNAIPASKTQIRSDDDRSVVYHIRG